jgi:adenylate cyclase
MNRAALRWPLHAFDVHRLRLASGAVMWVYIAAHFTNHALGLISLDAAEAGLRIAVSVWQSLPGTALLYGAFTLHVLLALYGLHQRRTLRLPPAELARIAFGLTIPLLLVGHVLSTRIAYEWYGDAVKYSRVVANLMRDGNTGWQLALLAPGWLHGCMGLNVGLRHRAWYRRWRRALLALAVALPLLAAAGYGALLRDVAALDGHATAVAPTPESAAQRREALRGLRVELLGGYFGALALVLGARMWRLRRDARRAPAGADDAAR